MRYVIILNPGNPVPGGTKGHSSGINYQESIIDAIDSSSIMVLIFSSHSNKSPHVLSEVNEAMSNEVIIIPFRIEDILPSKAMKYLISTPHWLDAMTPPLEQHIRELEETIRILIEKRNMSQSANDSHFLNLSVVIVIAWIINMAFQPQGVILVWLESGLRCPACAMRNRAFKSTQIDALIKK